jgi:hypothetical protein
VVVGLQQHRGAMLLQAPCGAGSGLANFDINCGVLSTDLVAVVPSCVGRRLGHCFINAVHVGHRPGGLDELQRLKKAAQRVGWKSRAARVSNTSASSLTLPSPALVVLMRMNALPMSSLLLGCRLPDLPFAEPMYELYNSFPMRTRGQSTI